MRQQRGAAAGGGVPRQRLADLAFASRGGLQRFRRSVGVYSADDCRTEGKGQQQLIGMEEAVKAASCWLLGVLQRSCKSLSVPLIKI